MLLVDTSAWIEHLRATGSPADVELTRLLAQPDPGIVVTPPVVMELLAGAATPASLLTLEALTGGLPLLALDQDLDFHAAAAVYRTARASGSTVRSLVDCLIAVVAVRHGATVLHRDRDYDVLAGLLPGLRVASRL